RRARGRRLRRLPRGERRHAYHLPRLQAGRSAAAAAIDPDLAGAQQLLQAAMAELGKVAAEPTVEAESVLVLGYGQGTHAAHTSMPRIAAIAVSSAPTEQTTDTVI